MPESSHPIANESKSSFPPPGYDRLRISSPSRIHFGLMSVGERVRRQYGGIGVMVQHPRTMLRLAPSSHWQVRLESETQSAPDVIAAIEHAAGRWLDSFGWAAIAGGTASNCERVVPGLRNLPVEVTVESSGPRHHGLGSGTQLALATGIALQAWFGLPQAKPSEMASAMNRAARSAIGTYGVYEGGFLLDGGKVPGQSVAQVDLRLDFPDWPIVLVFPRTSSPGAAGLYGSEEIQAFESIVPTTPDQFKNMSDIIRNEIVPGILDLNYARFAAALLDYGQRSGGYFREVQGGVYANATIADTISTLVDGGTVASGQTSWGPCIFGIDEDADRLRRNASRVVDRFPGSQCIFTAADNSGANVTTENGSH